mgnify:CR=1 FL=1
MVAMVALSVWVVGSAMAQRPTRSLPADLSGTYAVTGDAPNGPYQATATVAQRGRVYEVRWTFADGGVILGVGFVQEDRFMVGYVPGPGVISYRAVVDRPLTLEAQWTTWGEMTVYSERMIEGPPPVRVLR